MSSIKIERMCPACVTKVLALDYKEDSNWGYEWLSGGIVWNDELVPFGDLHSGCAGIYKVVWGVRTQLAMKRVPDPEYLPLFNEFRSYAAGWIGFRQMAFGRGCRREVRLRERCLARELQEFDEAEG